MQAVLPFGEETWFLMAEMSRNLERVQMGFLRQMTGQKANRKRDGTWRSEASVKVLKEAVTKTLGVYIDKR